MTSHVVRDLDQGTVWGCPGATLDEVRATALWWRELGTRCRVEDDCHPEAWNARRPGRPRKRRLTDDAS